MPESPLRRPRAVARVTEMRANLRACGGDSFQLRRDGGWRNFRLGGVHEVSRGVLKFPRGVSGIACHHRRGCLPPVEGPGQKSPFWAVKHPARPYKSAIESRFTVENATGVQTPRAGPDSRRVRRRRQRQGRGGRHAGRRLVRAPAPFRRRVMPRSSQAVTQCIRYTAPCPSAPAPFRRCELLVS